MGGYENFNFFILFFGFLFGILFMLTLTMYRYFQFKEHSHYINRMKYYIAYMMLCGIIGILLFLQYDYMIRLLSFGGFDLIIVTMLLLFQVVDKKVANHHTGES